MGIEITGVSAVINQLERYKNRIDARQHEMLKRLAEIGIETAGVKFAFAQYDGTNDVTVEESPKWISDSELLVSAHGKAIFFIEFGTGVHYTMRHPLEDNNPYGLAGRGEYGHKLGGNDTWQYRGEPGTDGVPDEKHPGYIKTHGNHPAMAMYEASKRMKNEVRRIAKEVFND